MRTTSMATGGVRPVAGLALIAIVAALAGAGGAAAQLPPARASSTPAPAAVATGAAFACPVDDIRDTPIAVALRAQALAPGTPIDPAAMMKDARTAAFVGTMMRQAQALRQIDYAGLCRYRADNAALDGTSMPQVILLGDSITENWRYGDPAFVSGAVLDRGVSGQTSSQILLRIMADAVALHPAVLHIMAGTNDILQNAGPVGDDDIVNNITAMIDIARAHRIGVVLASIPPISVRSWQPALRPAARIVGLNARLRALADARGIVFADYFTPLKDAAGGLDARFGNDGVHPNRDGYALMAPIATAAIARARP